MEWDFVESDRQRVAAVNSQADIFAIDIDNGENSTVDFDRIANFKLENSHGRPPCDAS